MRSGPATAAGGGICFPPRPGLVRSVQLLLLAAVAVSVVLVSLVVPDLRLPASRMVRLEVVLLLMAQVAISLGWVCWIERMASRGTGSPIPFSRRILIPTPVLLAQAMMVKIIVKPFGGYGTDGDVVFYQNAALGSIVILPFLLKQGVPARLRFFLSVWGSYVLWAAAMFLLWDLALRTQR